MSSKHNNAVATVIGIDIGKNSFHIVGLLYTDRKIVQRAAAARRVIRRSTAD